MDTVFGNPTQIIINGEDYLVQSQDHIDQVFYHVSKGGKLYCILSINENAEWESDRHIPQQIINQISNQIEQKEI